MHGLCMDAANQRLGSLVWEHISAGGKRLRAHLAVRSVQTLAGNDHGVAWGAACELLHNASLIHDDIQDGDRTRRGRPSLWARYGAAQALNAGDLCIALSYAAIGAIPGDDGLRWQLASCMTRASRRIVEGQARELGLLRDGALDWHSYVGCVEGKTAALFALPVEGAALIAGRTAPQAKALADACRSLGLLFQIQDDILDLYGNNGRERRGSDIAQPGKVTAMVVEHLRLHPEERDWLLEILDAPRAATTAAQVQEVTRRFAERGALAAVWGRIEVLERELAAAFEGERPLGAVIRQVVDDALRPVAHTRAD